jgi:hypothetical protein
MRTRVFPTLATLLMPLAAAAKDPVIAVDCLCVD